MKPIIPVLLAGGAGKRLWPISRKSYPKQFSNIVGTNSLFQESALRLISSDQILFEKHITVTNYDFRFIVSEQLQKIGIDPGPILIEPESKNTAPAILAAALYAIAKDKDAILLVSPSDHLIPDIRAFHDTLSRGLNEVLDGKIVTMGIYPTRPETGYGYLSLSKATQYEAMTVKKFIEKPDSVTAQSMIKTGTYLWNAGIFLFKAADMIAAFETLAPDNFKLTKDSVETAQSDLGFLRMNPEPWSKLEDISIDYAIMEKAKNLVAIPYLSKWSDLGDWDAVWAEVSKDQSGTALSEAAHAIDCSDTLLRSECVDQQIVGLGLNNIIAIAMPDAVLIAQKNRVQDVKKVVDLLKLKNINQAEIHSKDFRPWGWFKSLKLDDCFQVKHIFVKPGAAISLQSHKYRSEHWIVVEGIAKVTIADEIKLVKVGHSTYVPKGAIHRMENPGKSPMVLIEVQVGNYLGEDDIKRYEDLYSRK
jgi:mannose-1-phosphate guanylyltransferase / mannose-6-phosphate isomerase